MKTKHINTLVITRDLDFASLWDGELDHGHTAAVLPAFKVDDAIVKCWQVRYPNIPLFRTPEEAILWGPNTLVVDDPSYEPLVHQIVQSNPNIVQVGSSRFLDELGRDPEVSRNAVRCLFPLQHMRRFIVLHPNPLVVQSEAVYFSLRYPEDQYVLDVHPYHRTLSVSARDILDDAQYFTDMMRNYTGLFAHRAGGMLSGAETPPISLFKITYLLGGAKIGPAIFNWSDGVNRCNAFLPPGTYPHIDDAMEKMRGAWKIRGALTVHLCHSEEYCSQAFRITPGMDYHTWAWLRSQMAPTQSWAGLWRSIGNGAIFDYKRGNTADQVHWTLRVERGVNLRFTSPALGVQRTFQHDYLYRDRPWDYPDMDVSTLECLENVFRTGLLQAIPLWSDIERNAIGKFLSSLRAEEVVEEEHPAVEEEAVSVSPSALEESEEVPSRVEPSAISEESIPPAESLPNTPSNHVHQDTLQLALPDQDDDPFNSISGMFPETPPLLGEEPKHEEDTQCPQT